MFPLWGKKFKQILYKKKIFQRKKFKQIHIKNYLYFSQDEEKSMGKIEGLQEPYRATDSSILAPLEEIKGTRNSTEISLKFPFRRRKKDTSSLTKT